MRQATLELTAEGKETRLEVPRTHRVWTMLAWTSIKLTFQLRCYLAHSTRASFQFQIGLDRIETCLPKETWRPATLESWTSRQITSLQLKLEFSLLLTIIIPVSTEAALINANAMSTMVASLAPIRATTLTIGARASIETTLTRWAVTSTHRICSTLIRESQLLLWRSQTWVVLACRVATTCSETATTSMMKSQLSVCQACQACKHLAMLLWGRRSSLGRDLSLL